MSFLGEVHGMSLEKHCTLTQRNSVLLVMVWSSVYKIRLCSTHQSYFGWWQLTSIYYSGRVLHWNFALHCVVSQVANHFFWFATSKVTTRLSQLVCERRWFLAWFQSCKLSTATYGWLRQDTKPMASLLQNTAHGHAPLAWITYSAISILLVTLMCIHTISLIYIYQRKGTHHDMIVCILLVICPY